MTDQLRSPTLARVAAIPPPHECVPTSPLSFGLIVPPSPFVVPPGWEWVHTAPFEGPSILAALLKGLGYRFTLLDMRDDPDPASLSGRIDGFDVVGVATYGDGFAYVRAAVDLAKRERPGLPVLLGGPLVTSLPEVVLRGTSADFAVVGEAEETLTELMDHISGNGFAKPVSEIQGLAWKDGDGRVVLNNPRPQLTDLDAIPFQDWSVWDRFDGRDIPEVYLSYSRGCACACTFCYRPFPKYAVKSVDRVRREIEYLAGRKFRMAWWNDLTFVTDKAYVLRLMDEALVVHDFRWTAFSRVIGLDVPILTQMKRRGLDLVLCGMESVSAAVLDGYRKGITRHAIVDAIKACRDAGVKMGGLFIVGSPSDTPESLRDLVAFCKEFKEVTRVKYLSALPGTPFYRDMVEAGRIPDETAHLLWLSREESVEEDIEKDGFPFFAEHLTRDDLRAVYREVNGTVGRRPYDYSNPDNVFLDAPGAFARRPEFPK